LLNLGYKHSGASVILIIISLSFVGMAILLKNYNDRIALSDVIAAAIIMGAILDYRFSNMIKFKRKESSSGETSQVFMTKFA